MPGATVIDGTSLRSVPPAVDACGNCGEMGPAGFLADHVCAPAPTGQATTAVLGVGVAMLMAPLQSGALGTRQEIQTELDGISAAVSLFPRKQPDQIMRECAAYSARLTELCVLLARIESQDRQYLKVRTQQVERWQTELDRQFKIASRLVEVMRQDIELAKGL